jgi:hypothetical protein
VAAHVIDPMTVSAAVEVRAVVLLLETRTKLANMARNTQNENVLKTKNSV